MKIAIVALLALVGCTSQLVAPPPEDIAVIRTTAEALPELVAKSKLVSQTAIDGLAAAARKRGYAEAMQAADYDLLDAGALADTAGKPLPPKFAADGTRVTAPGERVAVILATKAAHEKATDDAIDGILAAVKNSTVHADLVLVADLLHDYLVASMTDAERRAALAASAHNLIYTKKEIR